MTNPDCSVLGCSRESVNRLGLCRRHLKLKRVEVLDELVARSLDKDAAKKLRDPR